MIASTNLVVELGLVMLVLLGWQFAAAEFVGGPIMIALLALAGGFVFTPELLPAARTRLAGGTRGGHDHAAGAVVSEERQEELEAERWGTKLRSPAAWSDASSYAVADATMLRKELLIGYTVAGLLAVLVPDHLWNALFLQGHGFWTTLENAMVGPLIAVASWVCSIGNVPLAAALWGGGISFGGVIAFIFADLIAMPLILVYRKFYGWRLTAPDRRPLLRADGGGRTGHGGDLPRCGCGSGQPCGRHASDPRRVGLHDIPEPGIPRRGRRGVVARPAPRALRRWGGLRHRPRVRHAGAHRPTPRRVPVHAGTTMWFCSDRCRERFEADPERYLSADTVGSPTGRGGRLRSAPPSTRCAA